VEVAPNADPPVCRILDYKKMQYEKSRKQKEARKNQRNTETKEVKLRPNVGKHDYETKLGRARDFLQKGHKVKVTLIFRQREMRRYDVGASVVNRMVEDVKDIATRESPGRSQMRTITCLLVPVKEITAEVERLNKEEAEQRKLDHEQRLREKHLRHVANSPILSAQAAEETAASNDSAE
jgi:translation initiation factor IF-3